MGAATTVAANRIAVAAIDKIFVSVRQLVFLLVVDGGEEMVWIFSGGLVSQGARPPFFVSVADLLGSFLSLRRSGILNVLLDKIDTIVKRPYGGPQLA